MNNPFKTKYIELEKVDFRFPFYRPSRNKKKLWVFFVFVFLCLVTPATNWLIPSVLKGISKLNPLFFYQ